MAEKISSLFLFRPVILWAVRLMKPYFPWAGVLQPFPSTVTSQLLPPAPLSHHPPISSFSLSPLMVLSSCWHLLAGQLQPHGEDRAWVLIAFPWWGALPKCLHSAAVPFHEMCKTLILPSPPCSQLWLKLQVRSKVVWEERQEDSRKQTLFFFLRKQAKNRKFWALLYLTLNIKHFTAYNTYINFVCPAHLWAGFSALLTS